jgi:putative transposase
VSDAEPFPSRAVAAPHDDLSRWRQWLMTSQLRRCHRHDRSDGHLWQARFKAFPIEAAEQLGTALCCVKRNA